MPGALELAAGLAPGIAWLVLIARKDDWEPEPWRLVLRVFGLGALAAVAIAFLRPRIESWYPVVDGPAAVWVDAFAITALSEELLKLAAVAAGALWLREWDEPLDGLVYGAAAGLGFAAIENAYAFAHGGYGISMVARAVATMLAHACFTASGAFVLGIGRLSSGRSAIGLGALGLGAAVALHGTYDLLLLGDERQGRLGLLLVLPLALVLFSVQVRWARARSERYHPRLD